MNYVVDTYVAVMSVGHYKSCW